MYRSVVYKALTSLVSRLPPAYRRASEASKKALLVRNTPQQRKAWNCQSSCRQNLRISAALSSATEPLQGMATQMLLGRADAYEGFLVSADDLPNSPDEFDARLKHSLQAWLEMLYFCALSHTNAEEVSLDVSGLVIFSQERHLDHCPSSKVAAHTHCRQAWI